MTVSGRTRCHRPACVAILFAALIAAFPRYALSAALPFSEDAPIVGGTVALARALGFDSVPDRARFVAELTRVIYDTPEGRATTTDALLRRLTNHLEVVGRFQSALAAVQPGDRGVALAMSSRKDDRNRLKDFLDLVGLKLREKNKAFTVERTDNKQAAERVKQLADLGVDLSQLATRLNKGETVRVVVPMEVVPIPLPAKVWSEAVFQRAVAVPGLVAAILGDRQAALLCHGLAALDEETLRFLAEHPAVVTRLYEHDAPAFSAFGDALRIRREQIVTPGGASAAALWEAVLDEKVSRPDRFIRELFGHNDGRVAYVYDTVAHLDQPRAAFALGLWMKDTGVRVDRFRTLVSLQSSGNKAWEIKATPFHRPPDDGQTLLVRTRAEPDGSPSRPFWRVLWEHALGGIDLPDDPAKQLRNVQGDGSIDAAWLLDRLGDTPKLRAEHLDQLAFGQRVFAAAEDRDLPDVLVALRAFPRYRMLMLTLDRMGVRTPAVYAAAARRAQKLSSLNANRAFVALGEFQGALALVSRMTMVRTLGTAQAEALVKTLVAAELDGDGRYGGAIVRWIATALSPAVGGGTDIDTSLVAALAGAHAEQTAPTIVTWEDQRYRVDLVGPEERRLTAVRGKLGAPSVALAVDIEGIASRLSAPNLSLADVRQASDALKKISSTVGAPKKGKKGAVVLPPGVDEPRDLGEIVNRAVQDLGKISKPKDVKKAERTAEPIFEVCDRVLADALMTLAYALNLGDPNGPSLLGGNVSHRHDFGFTARNGEERLSIAWSVPLQAIAPGEPWHVRGSVLGLDIGLAALGLHRISTDKAMKAPVLSSMERETLAQTVALFNAFEIRDSGRDAIAAAIRLGRERVTALQQQPATLDALADEVAMDGWRRRAVAWAIASEPARVAWYFSLRDLLSLGHVDSVAALDGWGMSAVISNGCLCTVMPFEGQWPLFVGRPQLGVLSTQAADLNLRVALVLQEHALPTALAKGVLASAMQDYMDEVKPIDSNDWLTLVRWAQDVPNARMEDYIAALTAGGPLVPDRPASSGGGR
jgi:hypothetical protein